MDLETELLSIEEFCAEITAGSGVPRYNNFFLYFIDHPYNSYRKKKHCLELMRVDPTLEAELTKLITRNVLPASDRASALKPIEPKLYEAYVIMRGFADTNQELFS